MLRPFKLRRPALFMIWKSNSQGGHAKSVEDPASFDMTIRLSIPLWQDNDGRPRFVLAFASGRE